ncbi:MAG: hypothetical protein ACO24O_09290, partial [Arenimonas sp.]
MRRLMSYQAILPSNSSQAAIVTDTLFDTLLRFALAWVLLGIVLSIVVRVIRGKPLFASVPNDALYVERWSSGKSNDNIFASFGGANNCLSVVVTKQRLLVQPQFP